MKSYLKDFKPTILFLTKFLVLYFVLNVAYGLYIDHYHPMPDPVTRWVSNHSNALLQLFGSQTTCQDRSDIPAVNIKNGHQAVLSIFEGCNGLNVSIIFVAFLLSFGRPQQKLLWFIPLGLVVIHLTNLMRITLLYSVSVNLPQFMYFAHKYLFTAIIYIVIFGVWYVWINFLFEKKRHV